MTSQDRFIDGLLAWLNRVAAPPGVTIHADTPLFEGRLIDSMRILELIAWTEREIDRTIPDEMVRMDNFHSVRHIADVFVEEVRHVER